jgi:hypothetical protein
MLRCTRNFVPAGRTSVSQPLTSDGAAAARRDRRPVFSTTDRRSRLTWPAPEAAAAGSAGGVVARALLCVVLWGVLAGPLCARLFGADLPAVLDDTAWFWWVFAGLVAGYLAVWAAVALFERTKLRFGQSRVAALLTQSAVAAGIALSAATVVVAVVVADERSAGDLLSGSDVGSAPAQLCLAVAAVFGLWGALAGALLHPPSATRPSATRPAAERPSTTAATTASITPARCAR